MEVWVRRWRKKWWKSVWDEKGRCGREVGGMKEEEMMIEWVE